MPQSLARNLVHLIFSTKHRTPLIVPAMRANLHGYLAGIFEACESPAITVGGVADHVHALFHQSGVQRRVRAGARTHAEWSLEDPVVE